MLEVPTAEGAAMPTTLTFLGAAGTVTGSKFVLEREGRRTMVDCGLYQGEREWRRRNWDALPVAPASISDVVLSHAHLDHCGYLPALVRKGFPGPVWATEGTAALAAIVLRDSAHLVEEEARYAAAGGWSKHSPPLPLYTVADAERAVAAFRALPFHAPRDLGDGTLATLVPAGHILGSASVHVAAGEASVLFSGDLGRPDHPLLRPRGRPPAARTVVVESTYGDRTHPAPDEAHAGLAAVIRRTVRRGGSVLVPAFAVDRTEVVLLALARLMASHQVPEVPVFVDSPMALKVLDVYLRPDLRAELRPGVIAEIDSIPRLHAAASAEESERLNDPTEPCIIVSASGMATGGRVIHHLAHMLPDRRHTVVLAGYQGVGTRGRALRDGATEVKIHGRYVRVRAEVVSEEEFSVHADGPELLAWLTELPSPPETVYVVHGEPEAARALAARVREQLDCAVAVPRLGEKVVVG
jgi:metallo-beta-lactamase family protein